MWQSRAATAALLCLAATGVALPAAAGDGDADAVADAQLQRQNAAAAPTVRLEFDDDPVTAAPVQSVSEDTVATDEGDWRDAPICGGLFDNMYYFGAVEGWKGIVDDDDNNNFGLRVGLNMGVPLLDCRAVGGQFGLSYNAYDFHGREDGVEESAVEEQLFFTAGVFRRSRPCGCWSERVAWGVVYDHVISDNSGEEAWETDLGQLRGQIGCALDSQNEIGVAGSFGVNEDELGGTSNDLTSVRALDQINLFWQHQWCWGAQTRLYVGIAEDPGDWLVGARGEVPISNSASLFGGFHYIVPSTSGGDAVAGRDDVFAEEFWNVSVGIALYPGGNAASKTVCGYRWMPLLPVADNGSFAQEVHPGRL